MALEPAYAIGYNKVAMRTDQQRAKQAENMRRYLAVPENRAKHNARIQRWRDAGGNDVRAARSAELRATKRRDALQFLGGACVRCGFDDERALQIDHVNGGGKREIAALASGSYGVLMRVLSGVSGYQLLCANCNWIKKHEQREGMRL
jgi:hypothetical protein